MFDVQSLRRQFPALHRQIDGVTPVFLDGPAGTQVPQRVIDAMVRYLTTCNANHGGVFATSRESDAIVDDAHAALADLLNAPSPDEVIFGANMTTLTFALSRALARTWKPGDEVIVTHLDHDANVSPWALAARDAGAAVRQVDIHPEDCTLDLDDFQSKLTNRTRLVAVGVASNAVGTLNDVRRIGQLAHEAGALVFLDAVHYAPHGPMDVQAWGCDILACSVYKFFGPHVGVLWGRRELLNELPAYKVRPSPNALPGKWMTGTPNCEGIAGAAAAVEYLADVGTTQAGVAAPANRRTRVHAGMKAIREYEMELARQLLAGLDDRPRFQVWGVTDLAQLDQRVPTISITSPHHSASAIAEHLARRHIFTWNGNLYALPLTERLGLEERGGFVRLGLVHYNTRDEVERLLRALDELEPA
jgi:cysteine desulfurase family protein (TIGR01976 family)